MTSDLSKLRIDKGGDAAPGKAWKRRLKRAAMAASIICALIAAYLAFPASHAVQAGKAAMAYPSRALTLLSASGYVVADRKASLATKATAKLIWIGVEEGSRAKKGDVVARLENEDVTASLDQAAAQLENARHRIAEAAAELTDATTGNVILNRHTGVHQGQAATTHRSH